MNETIKKSFPPGPIQLVVEAGKCNTKPILVRLVQRLTPAGAGEWSAETHDVRHGALLYDDLYDFGESRLPRESKSLNSAERSS